jgi:hypothetical protein
MVESSKRHEKYARHVYLCHCPIVGAMRPRNRAQCALGVLVRIRSVGRRSASSLALGRWSPWSGAGPVCHGWWLPRSGANSSLGICRAWRCSFGDIRLWNDVLPQRCVGDQGAGPVVDRLRCGAVAAKRRWLTNLVSVGLSGERSSLIAAPFCCPMAGSSRGRSTNSRNALEKPLPAHHSRTRPACCQETDCAA